MTPQDFQRNFGHSYFGLYQTPEVLGAIAASHEGKSGYIKLEPGMVIPCTLPRYPDSKNVQFVMCVPIQPSKTILSVRLMLPFKEGMDEDRTLMNTSVPSTGMLQIGPGVVYGLRIPVREPMQHGYAPQCHAFQWVGQDASDGNEISDKDVTWRIYNKIRRDWTSALKMLETGEYLSVAVERFLALGIMDGRRLVQIFYKKHTIGFVKDGQPSLYQEYNTPTIQDYVYKLSGIFPLVK